MPGYIRGFVEREFADRWELVCRVDPSTGSQGTFKYVFFGTGWASQLEPVVHTKGLAEELAPATKFAMMGRHQDAFERHSNTDLHRQFQTFRDRLTDHTPPRHVTLEELLDFDWEAGVNEDARIDLANNGFESVAHKELRLFKLVDDDGTPYAEWGPEEADGWRSQLADTEELHSLLEGEWIEFADEWVTLRAQSRHELLPEKWFDLLRLLYREGDYRDVRFSFFWHH
jgi:hypothetical protein